jgi:hypothetical protein
MTYPHNMPLTRPPVYGPVFWPGNYARLAQLAKWLEQGVRA